MKKCKTRTYGNKLRAGRVEAGRSQAGVATALGISASRLSKIENGFAPSAQLQEKIKARLPWMRRVNKPSGTELQDTTKASLQTRRRARRRKADSPVTPAPPPAPPTPARFKPLKLATFRARVVGVDLVHGIRVFPDHPGEAARLLNGFLGERIAVTLERAGE